ncbi:ArsR family transcriptional regulator [Metallosphaera tengchongensis]|uniref:ArsR family transcriptional regulator n=1 Tax=Metallosphaera tengchongensis TaxID=1532350 RepID=A0A6N0NUI8_9CREN|nr:ArsR family transcriptional regulator [Metallosphaera tengchongensis]QKQ99147.1 ArsR family transcriptional regulator [Metallosphaera tengchongensis]
MNTKQIAILSLLLEGELSISEISEYVGISGPQLRREINYLLKRNYVEKKAFIGNELILCITEEGIEELMREYPLLKSLVQNLETTLCVRFGC